MSDPSLASVHVDAPLTNLTVANIQSQADFAAPFLAPIIPVQKQSDKYFIFDQADFNRDEMKIRARGTAAAEGGYKLSTDTFFCNDYRLARRITDEERDNSDAALNPDADTAAYLASQAMIRWERLMSTTLVKGSLWTGQTDQTGVASSPTTNQFLQFDQSGSDPLGVLRAGMRAVRNKSTKKPNTLLLGASVADVLLDHPDIIDRLKYTSSDATSMQLLARLLGLDRVVVSEATYETADEGISSSVSAIVGKAMLLAYIAPTPGKQTPSAAYTFAWTGNNGANAGNGMRVWRYRMPEEYHSDKAEASICLDVKAVSTVCGAYFASVVG